MVDAASTKPDDLSPSSIRGDNMSESRMNRIARRAHEIYQGRGGQHGKALEDWLQAEREVDAELAREDGVESQ